jgi:Arc/MetJ family transcription regulator
MDGGLNDGLVYDMCVARTNIDLDERAVRVVMDRYDLHSKREAVNYALRRLADEAMSRDESLAMEGAGWEGNLDQLRQGRIA